MSSLDADFDEGEGVFYTWKFDEIQSLFSNAAQGINRCFPILVCFKLPMGL